MAPLRFAEANSTCSALVPVPVRMSYIVIWWYKRSPRQFIGATTAHRGRSRRTALCKPNTGGMWFSMLQFHQGPCCRCTSGTARSMATARRLRGRQHSSGAGRCADKPDSWNDRDRFHQQKGPNVGMRQKLQSKMHITRGTKYPAKCAATGFSLS